MSFFLLIVALSGLAYVPQYFLGFRKDYRIAMRHGTAGGFTFTGIDHFVHAHNRYVPMLPDVLAEYALAFVYLSGAAELAGTVGLVLPLATYRRLGVPNLRTWAGIGLAVLLVFLVVANVNVAVKGSGVQRLEFGAWYYWLRLLFQPIFILWALFVAGILSHRPSESEAVTSGNVMLKTLR